MVKKKVKEAMQRARQLEKIPVPSDKELLKIYKEAKESVQRLNKLLKPKWFVNETAKKTKTRRK